MKHLNSQTLKPLCYSCLACMAAPGPPLVFCPKTQSLELDRVGRIKAFHFFFFFTVVIPKNMNVIYV